MGSERENAPMAAVYVSPAVYAFAVITPDPRKFPPVDASHREKSVASCDPEIPAQEIAALFDTEPAAAVANVIALREASVAGFDVPAAPGAPMWSCTYTVGDTTNDVALHNVLSHWVAR
jgi:hypothetical protein